MPQYQVGQLVRMKKGHPCGANCWRIIRVGMDFRLKCLCCGRSVLMPRGKFERRFNKFLTQEEADYD